MLLHIARTLQKSRCCRHITSSKQVLTKETDMSKRKAPDSNNPNADFCDFLTELANYEKNVNRQMHKYNVYRKAASVLSKHPTRITSGKEARKLDGIGDKIGKRLMIYTTGQLQKLVKIPAAARKLVVEEGIKSIEELKNHTDKLNHHQKIGLRHHADFETRIPRAEVTVIDQVLQKELKSLDDGYIGMICGSYRRGKESSGDVDMLLTHPTFTSQSGKKPTLLKAVVKQLEKTGFVTDTISFGDSKFMGVCKLPDAEDGTKYLYRRLDLRIIPHDQYFCGTLYFTGSDLFNKDMRGKALEEGFTLNEYTIRPMGSTGIPGEPLPVESEEDIFDYIGMKFKKPSERNM
ncbi:DNA polymerase beta-like [Saccoglossus kowalevskii]|uniref:DNA polymerase n=1 Tax=Saccoglossus kowalevskii TaxID=10224 RepID=A0ABM0MY21_SACKO|nr:PREDICTED: DNA polymerase beta-like [Saccoglossus kowalevskii]